MGAVAGLAAGGSVLSAYSQIQSGKAGIKTANRQQDYYNTRANQVINQGDYQSDLITEQGQQTAATQKVGFAANGIDTSSGSAQRTQDSTIENSLADASQVRKNAFNQAYGLVTQGNEVVNQAKTNNKSSRLNALGSLLTGGSRSYSMLQ
ncbi:hypothetical protein HAQ05_25260 [Pseudomonas sp. CA3A]|uniref:Phage protein n=1 Tax=Pseudomonas typographi TaxID=2715964 RepID=A0ABR7Z8W8_9PSED|nr:hypothetical protein [Pseudomonas typographi]MBD1601990.1 hypothetical protein [Pseudomonas typographi]